MFISTDHYKGKEGGTSPGYGVSLVAQSTAGCVLGVERAAAVRELPEDLGEAVAQLLCEEVAHGGCVDTSHQVRIAITRLAAAAVGSAWLCGWRGSLWLCVSAWRGVSMTCSASSLWWAIRVECAVACVCAGLCACVWHMLLRVLWSDERLALSAGPPAYGGDKPPNDTNAIPHEISDHTHPVLCFTHTHSPPAHRRTTHYCSPAHHFATLYYPATHCHACHTSFLPCFCQPIEGNQPTNQPTICRQQRQQRQQQRHARVPMTLTHVFPPPMHTPYTELSSHNDGAVSGRCLQGAPRPLV